MASRTVASQIQLVNGSTGDPILFVDYPGKNDALMFDAGEMGAWPNERLKDLEAVFITHHHVDHFIGFDRIVRANLDTDKNLQVFGPIGTIAKIYDRIRSYEYPFFPFQRVVVEVHEVLERSIRTARLECSRRFPEPVVEERDWTKPLIYSTGRLEVEAGHVDHTVPCLAYALVERAGFHPDRKALAAGPLRPGPWIQEVQTRVERGDPQATVVAIEGGSFPLGELAARYFVSTGGARIAYITDTLLSDRSAPVLRALARKADLLFCDSFYMHSELKQAQKHRHMTAVQAAELAVAAKAKELRLIHFASRYAGRYQELVDEARTIFPRAGADF
jgi:ribonuclease Z